MEQLLEKSELKTRLCHRLVMKMKFKKQVPCKQLQHTSMLNKLFMFRIILLYLTKYFCKHEIFLQFIMANMKVYSVVL